MEDPPLPDPKPPSPPPPSASTSALQPPNPLPSDPDTKTLTPPLPEPSAMDSATKRRRKKKPLFSDLPTSRSLRIRSPAVYDENLVDDVIQTKRRRRGRGRGRPRMTSSSAANNTLAREMDVEALIATALGFPYDALTEEEIESSVVAAIGGVDQANYIIVRNHIIALWRSNISIWMTPEHAMESILSGHRAHIHAAYNFLLDHGYINFGVASAIKEIGWRPPGSPTRSEVLIVGAGLAGLAAARHLLSLGFKVAVIEGRNRAGGRVQTRKLQGKGIEAAVDLGGSVLTGINGNPLCVLARQLGIPLHKIRDNCPLYLPDGNLIDKETDSKTEILFNQILERVCALRESILEEMKSVDVSLGTAFEAFRRLYEVGNSANERMLLNWHLANLEYANAGLLSDLSMSYWDQDDPHEMGGDHCLIPGGNGRFVKALTENLPIFYDKKVKRIQYGSDGVLVYAGDQIFKGEMVICTVPLGVLKKGTIEFVPELPLEKREAIQRLGFGVLNKVAMLFPFDFWGGEIDTFGWLSEEESRRGEFFLFYSYASVAGGPVLVALVAGESAIEFEKEKRENVERVMVVLRKIFSLKGVEVPDPIEAVCTGWGEDEYALGSYSHIAVGSSGDDYDVLAESVEDRVFFAGEATSRKYPATMHGALLSGMREAANVLRTVRKRGLEREKVNGGG